MRDFLFSEGLKGTRNPRRNAALMLFWLQEALYQQVLTRNLTEGSIRAGRNTGDRNLCWFPLTGNYLCPALGLERQTFLNPLIRYFRHERLLEGVDQKQTSAAKGEVRDKGAN
jgi:hypothetical protein